MNDAMNHDVGRRTQFPEEAGEHGGPVQIAARVVLALEAHRRFCHRSVIHSEFDGSTAAVEGQHDHEVTATIEAEDPLKRIPLSGNGSCYHGKVSACTS
jgi:hypothetical protein